MFPAGFRWVAAIWEIAAAVIFALEKKKQGEPSIRRPMAKIRSVLTPLVANLNPTCVQLKSSQHQSHIIMPHKPFCLRVKPCQLRVPS
jgi:hypothetical protein